jgi:hypothetical protein
MQHTDGVKIVIVIQLSKEIVAIHWKRSEAELCIDPKCKMLKIKIQNGPDN